MYPMRASLYGLDTLDEIHKVFGDDDIIDLPAVERVACFVVGFYNGETESIQIPSFAELGGSVVVVARSD